MPAKFKIIIHCEQCGGETTVSKEDVPFYICENPQCPASTGKAGSFSRPQYKIILCPTK